LFPEFIPAPPPVEAASSASVFPERAWILAGPKTNPVNAHVYYLLTQNTWTYSERAAQVLGGHLATIRDAAEQQWLVDTFSSLGGVPRSLWLGARFQTNENKHVWVSGEPLRFRNWAPDQPDFGHGTGESFIHVWSPGSSNRLDGQWNDALDRPIDWEGFPLHGVVEVVPSRPPTNP
jgi:hypothetical protein